MGRLSGHVARASQTLASIAVTVFLMIGRTHADIVTFVVDEGAVPGAHHVSVSPNPNDITGKYRGRLLFNPGSTFQGFLVVDFTSYVVDGNPVSSQIGAVVHGGETKTKNLYGLYALVTVSGVFFSQPIDAGNTLVEFTPLVSTVDVYTDPRRDTEKDYTTATVTSGGSDDQHVMTASALDAPRAFGQVMLNSSQQVLTGSYAMTYTKPDVLLDVYWPTLGSLALKATVGGDVDTPDQHSVFPTDIRGDTNITF